MPAAHRTDRRLLVVAGLVALLPSAGCAPSMPPAAPVDASDASPIATSSPNAASSDPPAPPEAAASPTTPPTPPAPAATLDAFDAESALAFAVELSDLGTREAGTPGDEAARRKIAAAFVSAGWILVREEVSLPQGGATQNLYAVRDRAHLTQEHVVVGGHHDTIGGSPGANDNASGIAVLVEVARELDDEADLLPVPVVLAAFGAEEYQPASPREHHLGSELYAANRSDLVAGAFIVDMVGNGPETRLVWLDGAPRTMADRMAAVAEAHGIAPVRIQARGDISDHGPFARRGLPAAFLWSGPDGRLHSPADTSEHLDIDDLRRAGDLTLAFIRGLAPEDLDGVRAQPS